MSATNGMTCPECGHAAPLESHFGRNRRRRVHLIAGALSFVGAGVANGILQRTTGGWRGLIPTTVLMQLVPEPLSSANSPLPFVPNGSSRRSFVSTSLKEELQYRFENGPMDAWQFRTLALRELPPLNFDALFTVPDVAPAGQPLCIRVDDSSLTGGIGQSLIPPVPPLPRLILLPHPREIGVIDIQLGHYSFVTEVESSGALPPNISEITFDIAIQRQASWMTSPVTLKTVAWTVPIHVVNDGRCPEDPAKTEHVRNGLIISIDPPMRPAPLLIEADIRYAIQPGFPPTTMDIFMDLMDGNRSIARSQFVYGYPTSVTLRCADTDRDRLLNPDGTWNTAFTRSLSVRISGDTRIDPCARSCCWTGSYTIPFEQVLTTTPLTAP